MKKMATCLLIALFSAMGLIAQEDKPNEIDYYQVLFGMNKQAIVEIFIPMDDTVRAESFWAIYENYEAERKEMGRNRITLIKKYVVSYEMLDDALTDDLIAKIEMQKRDLDGIIYKYYKRIRKKVGSKEAGQFYQVESYLLNSIRADVLETLPFIGEFD